VVVGEGSVTVVGGIVSDGSVVVDVLDVVAPVPEGCVVGDSLEDDPVVDGGERVPSVFVGGGIVRDGGTVGNGVPVV
jgi:hypothetical protein